MRFTRVKSRLTRVYHDPCPSALCGAGIHQLGETSVKIAATPARVGGIPAGRLAILSVQRERQICRRYGRYSYEAWRTRSFPILNEMVQKCGYIGHKRTRSAGTRQRGHAGPRRTCRRLVILTRTIMFNRQSCISNRV